MKQKFSRWLHIATAVVRKYLALDMAVYAGSFTEGSTIEISCDGPLRAPYTCYLQGGVNFTAGRAAVLNAVQNAFFAE